MLLAVILTTISSCKQEQEKEAEGYDAITNTGTQSSPVESGIGGEEDVPMETSSGITENAPTTINEEIYGRFFKSDKGNKSNCSCYCLDIDFTKSTTLCLVPDKMYINSRFEKQSDNSINVYFEGPGQITNTDKEIPWEKFDNNEPIAKITRSSNGNIELDWLGFTINNDLAIDYAMYGKETEGTYKKY